MNNLYWILLLLGGVQGVTEFLPISSSGHLVILEQIPFIKGELSRLGESMNLFINVALHMATLAAVVIYFFRDIVSLTAGFFTGLVQWNFRLKEFRIALYIIVASIPAAVIGFILHDFFVEMFNSAASAFIMLIINGFILLATKKIPPGDRNIEETGLLRVITIGFFQALAIMPGISRSGSTIAGGMFNRLVPVEAARFSFLMAVPVIFGAGLFEGVKASRTVFPAELMAPLALGMIFTVLVALVAIKVLMLLVHRIHLFGIYTILLGLIGLGILFLF